MRSRAKAMRRPTPDYLALVRSQGGRLLVAEPAGSVIAYGAVVDIEGIAMLCDLFVAADARGTGVGTRLVGRTVRRIGPEDDVQLEAPSRARGLSAGRNGAEMAAALPSRYCRRRRTTAARRGVATRTRRAASSRWLVRARTFRPTSSGCPRVTACGSPASERTTRRDVGCGTCRADGWHRRHDVHPGAQPSRGVGARQWIHCH